ncbi:hypothetical protein [Roseibium sp.]|uniref:hypothetical protein n=1 Tax=Roseibium sp. TaxID=1936156 RepID=UPI003D0AF1E5
MSAQNIFDHVPLGAIVRFTDGTPQPPKHHTNKLRVWKRSNDIGRLTRKTPAYTMGKTTMSASITLHMGDMGNGQTPMIRIYQTMPTTSRLEFSIVKLPKPGEVLIFDKPGEQGEFVHLAASRADAEEWLSQHGYPDAVLEEVTDELLAGCVDEVAA